MEIVKNCIETRDEIIKSMRECLIGPGAEGGIPDKENELLTDIPSKRYVCGILYPQKNEMHKKEDDDGDDDGANGEELQNTVKELGDYVEDRSIAISEDRNDKKEHEYAADDNEEGIQLSGTWHPSSFGVTCFVQGNIEQLELKISFATYRKTELSECRYPFDSKIDLTKLPTSVRPYLEVTKDHKFWILKEKLDWKIKNELKKDLEATDSFFADVLRVPLDVLAGQCETKGYIRMPHKMATKLFFGDDDYVDIGKEIDGTDCHVTALRKKMSQHDGVWAVTVMMVNEYKDNRLKDYEHFIHQPQIVLSAKSGRNVSFFDRHKVIDMKLMDDEEKSLEMLYRNKKDYASGLGCSVDWDVDEKGKGFIKTEFIPEKEMPSIDFSLNKDEFTEEEQKDILSMKILSDLDNRDKQEKIRLLDKFIDSYETWIKGLDDKKKTLAEEYQYIAQKNIASCKEAACRMRQGISLLQSNPKVQKAFELANRAMFMQRIHLDIKNDEAFGQERYGEIDEVALIKKLESLRDIEDYNKIEDKYKWRPFQLAFILMSLQGIVDEKSTDRMLVDLIWFPTGGGKTEAYLGLSAFVIFYRRLAYPEQAGGTNIIMRYTLRLLTAQQFTRAATLICACEAIRKSYGVTEKKKSKFAPRKNIKSNVNMLLGVEPITIGLWIGGTHTPNTLQDARKALKDLKEKNDENKFQVLKCPWCGTHLVKFGQKGKWGYDFDSNGHFVFACPQKACRYHYGLPIHVVDEELYMNPPTLLIGTVDKFAMISWKNEVGHFLGVGATGKVNGRGPELIIQDELHLISGPLGSIVGLYETAIDYICKEYVHHSPKIIASTATIRCAAAQCSALYDRETRQFPAPGLDSSDSFFVRESEINHEIGRYGRKYIGVMGLGNNKATMEVTMLADLLQIVSSLKTTENVKDAYWTLTGYFNSLRELGQCQSFIGDDVKVSIQNFAVKSSSKPRFIYNVQELTSHVTTTQLNRTLDDLERRRYKKDENLYPVDVLLSSNMLSVGVDVARLNLMLMVGQPKLTSEYIQASSRVGRNLPGVVFMLYDQARSRDRSYYEQFKVFHDAFYKYVEPTGATPFSKPARDRGLHAIVVAILRNVIAELSGEKKAIDFESVKFSKEIENVKSFILGRVNSIRSRGTYILDESEDIKSEISLFLDRWEMKANAAKRDKRTLVYGNSHIMGKKEDSTDIRLMKPFYQICYDEVTPIETLTSMRNVDTPVPGDVLIWEDEK